MGARKRQSAEVRKLKNKSTYTAKLYNNPTSPQKARIVADLVRGEEVNRALNILENTRREPAVKIHKLLKSAIANWQSKNEGLRIEDAKLFINEISIDGGRILKRIKTAPQGRAARIRKRSNHIILSITNFTEEENIIDDVIEDVKAEVAPEVEKENKPEETKPKRRVSKKSKKEE